MTKADNEADISLSPFVPTMDKKSMTNIASKMLEREHRPRSCDDSTQRCDSQAGRDFRKGHEGYNSIPSLAVVFNLCDRRFDTRSGRMTWHLMKK